MSKKHPGRDTDYAKWTSFMKKVDNELRKAEEERKHSSESKKK